MISIHSNASSMTAQRQLGKTQSSLQKNLRNLTSGLRINSAADDAAGLAVSEQMNVDLKSLGQAKRNANNAISVLQTADGAMSQHGDVLTRMRELAVQANDDTLNDSQRDALNEEFTQLQTHLGEVADKTEFNGKKLLDGSLDGAGNGLSIQVGVDAADSVEINIGDMTAATLGVDALSLGSAGDPDAALAALDTAIETVSAERSNIGGMMNRMDSIIEGISISSETLSAAKGRITDVDVASEMADFTKNQVLMQAGSSMLAQANSQPQSALSLLG